MIGPMEPARPCREMPTRHCPVVYDGVCGERPCARFESEDETPWVPKLPSPLVDDLKVQLDDLRGRLAGQRVTVEITYNERFPR